MKNLLYTLLLFCCVILAFLGCSKSNNYSTTDHTVGIVNTTRTWSGTANGFVQGDTVKPPNTAPISWAIAYNRTITDTSFAVQEINGFEISVLGYPLNYHTTDSVHQIIEFDTTMSGSAQSFLKYYYAKDSMSFEFHQVTGFNSNNNQYYQTNYYLHTNPM